VVIDLDELMRANDELAAELAAKAQGAQVVLLVCGNYYAEVVRKEGDQITLQFPNRYVTWTVAEVEERGFKAVRGLRTVKANGSLMYAVPGADGTDWYIAGHKHAAVRSKKK
jgi:hypothetical protein